MIIGLFPSTNSSHFSSGMTVAAEQIINYIFNFQKTSDFFIYKKYVLNIFMHKHPFEVHYELTHALRLLSPHSASVYSLNRRRQ